MVAIGDAPDAERVINALRSSEEGLRAAGVQHASIFGSVARGEATAESDVDVLLRFDDRVRLSGLAYFGALEVVRAQLEALLGRPVDVVTEPIMKMRLKEEIARDRISAF